MHRRDLLKTTVASAVGLPFLFQGRSTVSSDAAVQVPVLQTRSIGTETRFRFGAKEDEYFFSRRQGLVRNIQPTVCNACSSAGLRVIMFGSFVGFALEPEELLASTAVELVSNERTQTVFANRCILAGPREVAAGLVWQISDVYEVLFDRRTGTYRMGKLWMCQGAYA